MKTTKRLVVESLGSVAVAAVCGLAVGLGSGNFMLGYAVYFGVFAALTS
jgi:hypothetical protein